MPLIVTHSAPDLDAISSVWLLTRFDAQHFSGSHLAFVNAGEVITSQTASTLGYSLDQVTHVDTGCGEFDHHFPARAGKEYCAAQLVYTHLLRIHPDLIQDEALKLIINHVLDVDHFGEAFWPDANNPRYQFMLHQIIANMDNTETNDDSYQVNLACRLLDFVYAGMKQYIKAQEKLAEGTIFPLKNGGTAFAICTGNDEVLAIAQKAGHFLSIKKDDKNGLIRIKARPDAPFNLDQLYQEIQAIDKIGTWYYHPSGKMLLNGSRKNKNHQASPLTLDEVINLVQKTL